MAETDTNPTPDTPEVPIENYDDLTAAEVVAELDAAKDEEDTDVEALAEEVKAYERAHKARTTILNWTAETAADEDDEESSLLPNTEEYRVCIAGAMYLSPKVQTTHDGKEEVLMVSLLGLRGEVINLTSREAHRLKGLAAVKPKDEPLSYDEMDDNQLDAAVKAAGLTVVSSGADADKPLRTDKINTLNVYDQGRGVAQR